MRVLGKQIHRQVLEANLKLRFAVVVFLAAV